MSEAIGIMDPAYFVNKNDILKWINNTLKLSIEKIDHLGTGAVYCQFLDMIYPGSICMGKVNWKAKLEYEYLSNFKLVTNCLQKNDVKKYVDVNKLVKCKYQDNLEFAQWFKKFFDTKCGDKNQDYDPEARRAVKVSSVVEVPKVARKEDQTKTKTINASIGSSAINTTQTPTNKKSTPQKPAVNNNNNKRTIGQLYNSNNTNSNSKTSTVPQKSQVTNPSISQETKEYNSLINSLKEILNKGDSDKQIVNQIRTLVKVDNEQTKLKENNGLNINQTQQSNGQSVFKDSTNTAIEQEN